MGEGLLVSSGSTYWAKLIAGMGPYLFSSMVVMMFGSRYALAGLL